MGAGSREVVLPRWGSPVVCQDGGLELRADGSQEEPRAATVPVECRVVESEHDGGASQEFPHKSGAAVRSGTVLQPAGK